MNALPDAAWLNLLIEALQTLQLQLLRLLDALGLRVGRDSCKTQQKRP